MPNPLRLLLSIIGLTTGFVLSAQQNELRSLANGLASDIAAAGKKAIAVVDFTDLQGHPTELGRFLSEEFSVALMRTHKGFEVIDRAHLKAILTEHKLSSTGLIDPATAKKLGQIVGADALLTGSMTPFSESVRITVKVIATDTARIVAADVIDLPKTKTITELIGGPANRSAIDNRPSPYEDGPPSMVRSPTSQSARPAPLSQATREPQVEAEKPAVVSNQYKYELIECRGVANSVTCMLRVTNLGNDRQLSHYCAGYNWTKAVDNQGNESSPEVCSLAGDKDERGIMGPRATLISGVPVSASFVFSQLNASATRLSVLNITGMSVGPMVKVSFRDVPIRR